MTLEEQLQDLRDLTNSGRALVDFIRALRHGKLDEEFKAEGKRWVWRPANAVALTVQHKKVRTIVISLYASSWHEFTTRVTTKQYLTLLPLWRGWRPSWVECTMKSPRQLAAALAYVEVGFALKTCQ